MNCYCVILLVEWKLFILFIFLLVCVCFLPHMLIEIATQVHVLRDPLVCGPILQPSSNTGQGWGGVFLNLVELMYIEGVYWWEVPEIVLGNWVVKYISLSSWVYRITQFRLLKIFLTEIFIFVLDHHYATYYVRWLLSLGNLHLTGQW